MQNIEELYSILRDFVVYYPKSEFECFRPQTFKALKEYEDLNQSNLGMTYQDKDKVYAWSRAWELSQYSRDNIPINWPIVTIIDTGSVWTNLFANRELEQRFNLEIAVIDKLANDCAGKHAYPALRTPHEIYKDTDNILANLFFYLREVKHYLIDGSAYRYLPEGLKTALLLNNTIDTAVESIDGTESFRKNLRINEGSRDNISLHFDESIIYGSIIKLDVTVKRPCNMPEFDYDVNRYNFKYTNPCC